MAKKKKKQQGHYCRICGDYKANEKFSGKGHTRHICKSCMSAMRSGKNPEDIFPEPLPVNRETIRFNKLGKEEKAVLKAFITEVTTEYWQENRQIPFADSFSELKKYIIETYDEECGILAQEKVPTKSTDNVMYFNHSSYIFEILKLDSVEPAAYGEVGRIVITDLHNYAFPLIRYDCGDTCIMMPPNEYSNGYPVIDKLYGRRFDLTYSTDGKAVSPLAYGRILKNYDIVSQWQFVQLDEKRYQLRLMLKSGSIEQLSEAIVLFKEILGKDADLEIKEVEDIPILCSGKRKPVINKWKNI